MNLKTAKTTKDINLAGIVVELETADGAVKAVTLRDTAGGILVIRDSGYGSMSVLVPAPPKLVARWRVRGAIGAAVIDETFDAEYSAKNRVSELGPKNVTFEKILVEE